MKAFVPPSRPAAFVLSLLAAALLAAPVGAQGLTVREKAVEGSVSFVIDSSPRGATVEVNGERVGTTPLTLSGYRPGSYEIRLSLDGFMRKSLRVNAVEGTQYHIMAELVPRRGFLKIKANPPGAEILIDGQAASEGTHYLRIGRHLVAARLFGYETQEAEVVVDEVFPQSVEFDLGKAAFALSAPSFSRPRFNPRSPGSLGGTVFSFRASAPGTGRLRVESPEGEVLAERDFSFADWKQSYRWNGRGSSGEILPDGEYVFRVEARGEDGLESSIDLAARIDSSARMEPRVLSSGVPGYALCPSASLLPAGAAEMGGGASFPILDDYSAAALPFWMGMRASIADPVELFGSVHGAAGPGDDSGVAVSGGLKWRFAERRGRIGFDAAIFAECVAALSGPLSAVHPAEDGTALGLGLPLGFAAGLFDLVLSPAFFLSFPPGGPVGYATKLSAALGLQTPSFDLHLSANAKYSLGTGFAWPVRTALDARFLPAFAPCGMTLGVGLDIERDGTPSPSLMAGLSVLI